MILRPYQEEALKCIHKKFEKHRSTLLVLPTGCGKTVVFAHLVKDYLAKGRVMVLAHREELVNQAWRTLKEVTGVEPDTEMGDYHANSYGAFRSDIVVGTIQTQNAGRGMGLKRMTKFDPMKFSLLIHDESHHAMSPSHRKVIEYYQRNPELKVLGCTATPDRLDKKAMGQVFESVAFQYELRDAIDDGWLVDIHQQSVYVEGLDYSQVRTTAGDLNGKDLARVLEFEGILHGFCSPIVEISGDRKTLIFAASLAQAERMTEIINRHKPKSARWVHRGTDKDERRAMWPAYNAGDFQYLINVGVLLEGFDEPTIEVVADAAPTKSRSRAAQKIGRGTRTLAGLVDGLDNISERLSAIAGSGKPYLEVLDFVGNCGRHKLITPVDILGGNYDEDIVERAKLNAEKKSAESGKPIGVIEELEFAEQQLARELAEEEERVSRSTILLRAKYSTAKVNPFEVFGLAPRRETAWHKGRQPTDNQIACLEKAGVDVKGLSFTHASQIIDKMIRNRRAGQASFKMIKNLQRFGFPGDLPFDKARIVMTALAKNSWHPLQGKQKEAVMQEIG